MIQDLSLVGFALGGFFVGFGTKLGNGCTSGHGLCGMPRLSLRSWLAVIIFFVVAVLTANFLNSSVLRLDGTQPFYVNAGADLVFTGGVAAGVGLVGLIVSGVFYVRFATEFYSIDSEGESRALASNDSIPTSRHRKDVLVFTCVGFIFGAGLIISGMVSRAKILGFLKFDHNWDPSLLIVFGTAVGLNLLLFQIISRRRSSPILDSRFRFPSNRTVDFPLILGSVCFGLGWGFSGFCPGPMIMNLLFMTPHLNLFFLVAFLIGQSVAVCIQNLLKKRVKQVSESVVTKF